MSLFTITREYRKAPWALGTVHPKKEEEVKSDYGPFIGVPAIIYDIPGKIFEDLKEGMGFVKKEKPKEEKKVPSEVPKPEVRASPFYINYDFDKLTEYAIKRLLEDVKDDYNVYFMPLKELNERFPCSYTISGWEDGNEIYLANDIPKAKQLKGLAHEIAAKLEEKKYPWKTHDELHPEIFASEEKIMNAYLTRAIKELRI
jgi:hypothetical protein